jgi:hypothetical protein
VAGVVAVDIDALYPITDPEEAGSATFSSVLVAETARFDAGSNKILPAQLLLINSITLTEMTS